MKMLVVNYLDKLVTLVIIKTIINNKFLIKEITSQTIFFIKTIHMHLHLIITNNNLQKNKFL